MTVEIDNFIEEQYRRYISDGVEPNSKYIAIYSEFTDERLRKLFSTMHADAINLFGSMNTRLPTGDETGHFWANASRDVIKLIEVASTLQDELKDTELAFHIDDYYDQLFRDCSKWLAFYNGSTIPAHMDRVRIYHRRPLFIPDGLLPFQELHTLGEKVETLGRGGFGEVYRYHHPILDMDFAVKVFDPLFASEEDRQTSEKRFFREAKMLFNLNHPNIVRIYDAGRIHGKPFIRIELVDGKTLDEIRKETGNFGFTPAAKATNQILNGLQHAHDKGILHRDLKPTNIMVQMDSGKWTCKIIDFGISAFMDTEGYTRLTKSGEQVAGGAFIDPELMRNPKLRNVRSDIYSVGAIMFFLLCGHAPGPDAQNYLKKSNRELSNSQISVVMKALSSDLEDRYNSCDEMRIALEEELEGSVPNSV